MIGPIRAIIFPVRIEPRGKIGNIGPSPTHHRKWEVSP